MAEKDTVYSDEPNETESVSDETDGSEDERNELIEARLKKHDRRLLEVPSDGICLLHATAYQSNGQYRDGFALKEQLLKFVNENIDYYSELLPAHLDLKEVLGCAREDDTLSSVEILMDGFEGSFCEAVVIAIQHMTQKHIVVLEDDNTYSYPQDATIADETIIIVCDGDHFYATELIKADGV